MVRRLEGGDEEKKNEEEDQAGRVAKIIEEEMGMLIEEDPSIIPQVLEVIGKLRRLIEGSMDDEILQTRIVSPLEVLRDWKEWVGPAEDEVNSLLHEKKAFKEISSEELEELKAGLEEEGRKIEIIPSKLVWTKKPDPNNPVKGKNKVRWVICGNFEEKKESEQTYSGGADSTALRAVVSTASDRQWSGATVDVKTAFLNAEMSQEEEDEVLVDSTSNHPHRERIVLRSSKSGVWAEEIASIVCRDEGLRQLEIEAQVQGGRRSLRLFQLDSEPNLWRISQDDEEHYVTSVVQGLVMTYVDDMVVVGSESGRSGRHLNRNGSQKVQLVPWVSRFPR